MKKVENVFFVRPSPFNQIKFELGVILVLSVLAWLLVDSITDDALTQVFLLAIFSFVVSGWLVLRVRRLSRAIDQNNVSHR